MKKSKQDSAIACAGWLPENTNIDLLNFPCSTESDCPPGDKCLQGEKGKFCNRNNVYQYWIYDPTDSSGFSCTKLLAGSQLCGVPKSEATAFDIVENIGPDQQKCDTFCKILPSCTSSVCCPQNWSRKGDSECIDNTGKVQCCIGSNRDTCLQKGGKPCETVGEWWYADMADIINGDCGIITSKTVQINSQTIDNQNFTENCMNKSPMDPCIYSEEGSAVYSGVCKPSSRDNKLRCFPDKMCIGNYIASNQPGTCSSAIPF